MARFAELSKRSKENAEAKRKVVRLLSEAKSLVDSGDLKSVHARPCCVFLRQIPSLTTNRERGAGYNMPRSRRKTSEGVWSDI